MKMRAGPASYKALRRAIRAQLEPKISVPL